jgi:prepilin-type N-terminal cleavage/methylation domain-containing protein
MPSHSHRGFIADAPSEAGRAQEGEAPKPGRCPWDTRMRILIVEDEHKIAAFLRKGLTENGFVVDTTPRRGPGRLGFTLVELLVVIAIIASS